MEVVHKLAGGKRTSASVKKAKLAKLWKHEHDAAFQASKDQLMAVVKLSHPKDGYITQTFTDASETHWSSGPTQIPDGENRLPLRDQRLEPLASCRTSSRTPVSAGPRVKRRRIRPCSHVSVLIIC
jgi:hypothetical protein